MPEASLPECKSSLAAIWHCNARYVESYAVIDPLRSIWASQTVIWYSYRSPSLADARVVGEWHKGFRPVVSQTKLALAA